MSDSILQDLDKRFMQEALKEARKAFKLEEVPVGAVLVYEGKVIARAHNQVETLQDATAHAEMICITMGSSALGNWRLQNAILYCTIEPCAMCAGAMLLSRVQRVVWGARDLRHGANGSWVDLFEKKHPTHSLEITRGICEEECGAILQEFFRKRRLEKEKSDEA